MTHEEYESKSQMKRVETLKAEEKQMNHKELLAKIDEHINYGTCGICDGECYKVENMPWVALRAVVELHKPDESDFPDEWESCVECSIGGLSVFYPCHTIQAIEKELG